MAVCGQRRRRSGRRLCSGSEEMFIGLLPFAALLESDGATLRDPRISYATLVMVQSPTCEPCKTLLPHLEAMQGKMNEDGAAVMIAFLDAVQHPAMADELGVRGAQKRTSDSIKYFVTMFRFAILAVFPTFAFFPSHASGPPAIFEGTSLNSLAAWTLEQLFVSGSYRPSLRSAPGAVLHPAAVNMRRGAGSGGDGGSDGGGYAWPPQRTEPPSPLAAAAAVSCDTVESGGGPPLGLVVGGDIEAGDVEMERFAVARRDISGRWLPLGATRQGGEQQSRTAGGGSASSISERSGALAGVARVLLRNSSSCLYAAGTLRLAALTAGGFEGDEESVVRWAAAGGGWAALHGPLRVRVAPEATTKQQQQQQQRQPRAHHSLQPGEHCTRCVMARSSALPPPPPPPPPSCTLVVALR